MPPPRPESATSHPSSSPLLLAGPTAVGKSEVALQLAERLSGEIISVDSMQVYRGLDIGTAKPTPADRARVPHHLVDVADLGETFDVARFCEFARRAVEEIQSRDRLPILCGGTGLYFKAFLSGLGEAPPADPVLRVQLEAMPLDELLKELEIRDPATFAAVDRRNPRRVVRAVEVIRLSGRPFSEQRAAWSTPGPEAGSSFFAVSREPGDLRRRIELRVDGMFRNGLVAETRRLLQHGLADNRTATQALGYRQVLEHIQGIRPLDETIRLVKIRTWQFARRQMTWFRRQMRPEWLRIHREDAVEEAATRILERLEQSEV